MTSSAPVSESPTRRLQVIRTIGLSILGFLLMVTYALARPATESMFLQAHTSSRLPLVWLMVAVSVFGAVAAYNRLVKGRHLVLVYGGACVVSGMILSLILAGRRFDIPYIHFALYVWKDIYVVVLVEIFYTYANTVFPIKTAKWVYGLFGAMGSIGGILGNLSVGWIANRYSSISALWVAVGILVFMGAICMPLARVMGESSHPTLEGRTTFTEALKIVKKSRYLLLILSVVALVQISITLVDYQFNIILERTYPNVDVRTGIIGRIYAMISFSTVLLNTLVGPILRFAGVSFTLMFIPISLGVVLTLFVSFPRFLTAAMLKITSKVFDYTIFRAAKEILYIPTSYAEKTQGKSIADMLTYRVAKGGASLLLLLLSWTSLVWLVLPISFLSIAAWLATTIALTKRFRSHVNQKKELAEN